MKKIFLGLLTIMILGGVFLFFPKKSKQETPKPGVNTQQYVQDTSQLVLPIAINIASFEPVFNQQMDKQGWFYEEEDIAVKKNLSISYRVKKDGVAQLYPQDGKIMLKLPLFIEIAPKGSGIYKIGIGKDTKLESKVTLDAEILTELDKDWDLNTQANSRFSIQQSPIFSIGGFTFDFTEQLEQSLKAATPIINKEVEEQVKAAIDIKAIINLIWEEIKTPYHISAEPFDAWAVLKPTDVAFTKIAPAGPGAIGTTFFVNSLLEIETGKRPLKVNTKKIPDAYQTSITDLAYTRLNFPLKVPYSDFTKLLNQMEKPFSFALSGNRNLTLSNFSAKGNGGQLEVTADFESGNIKGALTINGYPQFDVQNQSIGVTIESIKTKSNKKVIDNLIKTIQKNKSLKNKVEEQLRYSLKEDLADLNFEITNQLKDTRFHEYAKLDGYINHTMIKEIYVEEDHFILATLLEANLKCIVQAEASSSDKE